MRLLWFLRLSVALLLTALVAGTGESAAPPHLILLLDTSSAMASQGRVHKIFVALKGWINDAAPEGIKISLWTFADEAKNIVSTVLDNTPISRKEFEKFIPQEVEGTSCIKCAINSVLKNTTENETILLITHGADKFLKADLEDLVKSISTSQSTVISALIGNVSNIHLYEKISHNFVNYIPDSNMVFGLLDVLQRTVLAMKEFPACVTIFEKEVSSTESQFLLEFNIDRSVTQYEEVCMKVYNWPFNMQLNLTHNNSTQYILNEELIDGYKKFCLLDKNVGIWKVQIVSSQFNKFVALQVTACKEKSNSSIALSCWIEKGAYYPFICGYIHDMKKSITEVKASVDIAEHNGKNMHLELQPMYSEVHGFFLYNCISVRKYINITEEAFYSVHCHADGLLSPGTNFNDSPEKFSRSSWGGTFKLDKSTSESVIASRITDLKVSCVNGSVIILQFTTPQHAQQYMLTFSSSLYTIFSEESILLGTAPGEPGTKEEITFTIPQYYSTQQTSLYATMAARGKNEIVGEKSNLVQITCSLKSNEDSNDTLVVTTEIHEIFPTESTPYVNIPETAFTTGMNNLNKILENNKEIPSEEDNAHISIVVIVTILAGVTLFVLSVVLRMYYVRRRKQSGTYYVQCNYQNTEKTEQSL